MANSQLNFHGINNRATVHCPPGKPPLLKELLEQAENMLVPLKILGLQISGDNPILCAPGDGAENLKEFYSNHSGPLKKWLKPIQSHTISAGTRAHRHLPELGGIFEYNGFTLGFPYELENASRVWFFINAPILSYFTPRKTKRLKKFLEHLATLLLKRDLEILRREHRANQRRQIGVGEMAHQLKTPLTQLEHTLKSLETNGASNVGKVQDGVKKIQQTQNFIRDYLFYLKTPETATSPIAVTKISQELKWYYTHDFARRKIKFTLHNCLAPDTQRVAGW